MMTTTTKRASELKIGDKVVEPAGMVWTVDNIARGSRVTTLSISCDDADFCICKPQPSVVNVGNDSLVTVAA